MITIAYIGYGFVGKSCHAAFSGNTNTIIIDPKYSTLTIDDLKVNIPDVAFVSVNAPTLDDRTVDSSIIHNIFSKLAAIDYKGIVVLKSTVPYETVLALSVKFKKLSFVYSPEFIREAFWEYDALHPNMVVFGGPHRLCETIHGIYLDHSLIKETSYEITGFKNAVFLKYAINAFLASKVVFMNQLRLLYDDMHPGWNNWNQLAGLLSEDPRIGETHLQVPGPDGQYGYGGSCFPKDVKAMIGFDKEGRLTVLREVELANTQLRIAGAKNK